MNITDNAVEMILIFIALVLSLGMHEAAHAKAAKYFGDTKPAEDGFDTWNPIPHIRRSLFTCVVLPAITWFFVGFFMGGAYVRLNPDNMKPKRLGHTLSVAAGPAMNLLISFLMLFLALMFALILKQQAARAIIVILYIGGFNLILFVFNLLPIPPLDGSVIIRTVFPQTERFFQTIGRFLFLGLFLLIQLSSTASSILFYPFVQYFELSIKFIRTVTEIAL